MSNQIESVDKGTSRRRFLGVLGIGVAGAAVLAALTPFGRRNQAAEAANEFPGPDSIFHPAQDPRTDPRR
ncbi:MAG: twin-arginine translocation signal domain-containing protein [Chloroflexi bacterium]|nr:twin-arginine translocation signal domain-containing protein [Chloroflexota bacterium]